jgi:hypothetical protein
VHRLDSDTSDSCWSLDSGGVRSTRRQFRLRQPKDHLALVWAIHLRAEMTLAHNGRAIDAG